MIRTGRAPLAWVPVGLAILAVTVLLSVFIERYGYHRDELYFRMLVLQWGYVDQPPLTPLLAKLSTGVFGDSLWALRLPAICSFVLAVLLTALITRALGGRALAQGWAAWAVAFAAVPLTFGHLLLTATIDLPLWLLVLLLLIHALRDDPRWWTAVGAAVGLALYNKLLIVLLALAVLGGLLLNGKDRQHGRGVLTSRWLWTGVGIALVVSAPNLIYQATHGWPQFTMVGAISERAGNRIIAVPFQLVLIGVVLVPIWVAGLLGLLRDPNWRPLRAVGLAYPIMLLIIVLSGGQLYYPLGLLIALFAAGCVVAERWSSGNRRRQGWIAGAIAFNTVGSVVIALPVLPPTILGRTPIPLMNMGARDQIGWPTYTRQIAEAYRHIPENRRFSAIIIANNYGEAGAVDRFGAQYGLSRTIYSGHNQLYFRATPAATTSIAVVVGFVPKTNWGHCEQVGVLDNGVGVNNEEQGKPIALCHDPKIPWHELWPTFRHED